MKHPMHRPLAGEYADVLNMYIGLVTEDDILSAMQSQLDEAINLLRGLPDADASVPHPPYTWSIKEVLGHVTDAERIFSYRALRFARADTTELPGFDENEYARVAHYGAVSLADRVFEFEAVRRSNLMLFRNLTEDAWPRSGVAFGNRATVHALAYVIVGHARHHLKILRGRLGKT